MCVGVVGACVHAIVPTSVPCIAQGHLQIRMSVKVKFPVSRSVPVWKQLAMWMLSLMLGSSALCRICVFGLLGQGLHPTVQQRHANWTGVGTARTSASFLLL